MTSIVSFLHQEEAEYFTKHNPHMNLFIIKETDSRFHVYNMEGN